MLAESYAQAVYESIEGGMKVRTALSHLEKVLDRKGHQKLYASVLRALVRYAEAKAVSGAPAVTVASEASAKKLHKEIATTLHALGTSGEPAMVIDDRLIGGFTAQFKGAYADHSYRGKLVKLYRTITKAVT